MLLTITITIAVLLTINFILLKFSCNKIKRSPKQDKKPVFLNPEVIAKSISTRLAPTGS